MSRQMKRYRKVLEEMAAELGRRLGGNVVIIDARGRRQVVKAASGGRDTAT